MRKPVTVLWCELVLPSARDGSPGDESPDVLHLQLSRFLELARDEVDHYGGTVHGLLGQSFMALFGAHVSVEDHPRRAILAAREIRRRVARESASGDPLTAGWATRMGIDTSPVVFGGIGTPAVGPATQGAARLQEAARSDQILVSDEAARTVRSRTPLVPSQGVDDAAAGGTGTVWLASDEPDRGTLMAFSERGTCPFVNREHEMSVLQQLRDLANEGRGQVALIGGEAGAGKSRLLYELYQQTHRKMRTSYLRGQCVSYGRGVPYLPLIDMIRKASRIRETDEPEIVTSKLEASLRQIETDPGDTLPFLLRVLQVDDRSEALDELEPATIRARTFAAMRRMILDASRISLVVLEIEDLQWIDDTTAEFLDSLVDSVGSARLLVLLTYRAGYQPKWLGRSFITRLSCGALSADDSRHLVQCLLEGTELRDEPPDEIIDLAEGNPFFLEELARTLIAQHDDPTTFLREIPHTIKGVLLARIDSLPQSHKRLLRVASVLGREPSLEVLREIWNGEPLDDLLRDLQRWELLSRAPLEDQSRYFFRQAITQEVVYQSLLKPRREQLHLEAAETLERLHAEHLEEVYPRLIYHYPRAGRPEKTVQYLTLFARRAADGDAHVEAARALRQALEHVEHLEGDQRDRAIVDVVLQLAESLLPLAQLHETCDLFERHRATMEALDDPRITGPYTFWLAHTESYLGEDEKARELAHAAIEAAKLCGDEVTEGKACYVLGRDGFWSGRFQAGVEFSARAIALLERNGAPWWQGQAYWVEGFNHFALGHFEDAIEGLERCLALGDALDDERLDPSWSLGYIYVSLGETEAGIAACERGLERAQDPLNFAVASGFLGHALAQKATEIERALGCLQHALERTAEAGMRQLEAWFSVLLADALESDGVLDAAHEAATRGLEMAERVGFAYGVGLACTALGQIELARHEHDEADRWLTRASDRFEELEVPFEVARAALHLGRLERSRGDEDTAARAFERALETFESLRVPWWSERARSLLKRTA